jgi:hypothetical protein
VRTFEVDESERVVGFSSKGCFWLVGKTPQARLSLFNFNKLFFLIIRYYSFASDS